ncbi:hypothetical protein CRENBAI_023008 [Crenichthys baileyi]|uniref:Uncharacterized protein n=1 Tax=Crenichthys baileyi TaxID=28760 RepID=A0AAV9RL86_9TELE
MAAACKKTCNDYQLSIGPSPPSSKKIRMHYSFDFAQQMHFPSNPLQPGPMYFLTPRKCGLFGVSCEGLQKQVNFLIDEGMSSGKGSNEVISLHTTYPLPDCWPHQICPRLWLWAYQTSIQEDQGQHIGRYRQSSGKQLS